MRGMGIKYNWAAACECSLHVMVKEVLYLCICLRFRKLWAARTLLTLRFTWNARFFLPTTSFGATEPAPHGFKDNKVPTHSAWVTTPFRRPHTARVHRHSPAPHPQEALGALSRHLSPALSAASASLPSFVPWPFLPAPCLSISCSYRGKLALPIPMSSFY